MVLALQKQIRALAHGIERTKERLTHFERQYEMDSVVFAERFKLGDLPETVDFIDWWMETEALRLIEDKYRTLYGAQIG
mgnify:CR=1 FL=1